MKNKIIAHFWMNKILIQGFLFKFSVSFICITFQLVVFTYSKEKVNLDRANIHKFRFNAIHPASKYESIIKYENFLIYLKFKIIVEYFKMESKKFVN